MIRNNELMGAATRYATLLLLIGGLALTACAAAPPQNTQADVEIMVSDPATPAISATTEAPAGPDTSAETVTRPVDETPLIATADEAAAAYLADRRDLGDFFRELVEGRNDFAGFAELYQRRDPSMFANSNAEDALQTQICLQQVFETIQQQGAGQGSRMAWDLELVGVDEIRPELWLVTVLLTIWVDGDPEVLRAGVTSDGLLGTIPELDDRGNPIIDECSEELSDKGRAVVKELSETANR